MTFHFPSRTLALLKPDSTSHPVILNLIFRHLRKTGLEIAHLQKLRLNRREAEQLYAIHRGKFFYERLIHHMTSGPIIAMVLTSTKEDAISNWRNFLGPSKAFKGLLHEGIPNHTLRQMFAISDARNIAHGSDSEAEFHREIQVFPHLFEHKLQIFEHLFEII